MLIKLSDLLYVEANDVIELRLSCQNDYIQLTTSLGKFRADPGYGESIFSKFDSLATLINENKTNV